VPAGTGLGYGTFLGGTEDDYEGDMAVGPDGATYVAGWTYSPDFPTTPGAFDTTYDEGGFGGDAFVSKLDPSGSALAYSTFLGGGNSDFASAMAVDAEGAVYMGGYIRASDFPTTPGAFDPAFNGGCCDAFLTKLNPQGSDLVYSTFLGAARLRASTRWPWLPMAPPT
jgi:hypothetical protein